jgi:hypothetical protein
MGAAASYGMSSRRYLAGLLAVTGGALMVISGYAARGFLYQALGYAEPHVLDLGGEFANAAVLAITIVQLVIGLGGLTVIAGGLIVLSSHTSIGRILILLGGAGGFLGLLISFGYSVYKVGGVDPILYYLPYWVGLTLAVIGRRLAKGA